MGNASAELELDCWAVGYIFYREAEIGFSLERDLTRSYGRSPKSPFHVHRILINNIKAF